MSDLQFGLSEGGGSLVRASGHMDLEEVDVVILTSRNI